MIDNFEELKKKISELAPIINSFKSEAVQLRIVELIFSGSIKFENIFEIENSTKNKKATKKHKKQNSKSNITEQKKSAKSKRIGPATILSELIDDGFFDTPKTINEMIKHCESKKARKFKPNELSPALARFIRNGKLKRDKNSDNQYEYIKG